MKTNLLLLLLLLSVSCKKEAIVCSGNCATLNISGHTFNKLNNTNQPNMPIALDWVRSTICICSQKNIFTGKSGSDGYFNISANIDTTLFKDYGLRLYVEKNDDFTVIRDINEDKLERYYKPAGYQNLLLDVYPKAILTIKLVRTQADNFQSFSIEHSAINDYNTVYDYSVYSPQEVKDRNINELNVPTVDGVFTKITTVKKISDSQSIINVDSVKCIKGSSNTFTVNF